MSTLTDGRLHRITLHKLTEREVAKRIKRWRRKRVLLTPALWMVALAAAFMTWFARRSK